jgi:hypothetical protein
MGRIAWKNSRTGKFRNESVNVIDKYGLSKFTKKSTLLSETSMLDEGNIIE